MNLIFGILASAIILGGTFWALRYIFSRNRSKPTNILKIVLIFQLLSNLLTFSINGVQHSTMNFAINGSVHFILMISLEIVAFFLLLSKNANFELASAAAFLVSASFGLLGTINLYNSSLGHSDLTFTFWFVINIVFWIAGVVLYFAILTSPGKKSGLAKILYEWGNKPPKS